MDSIQANITGRAVPRLGLSPDEAAASAGVSRTKIFEAVRDGALTARKSGKATIIEVSELRRWIRRLPTRGRAPDSAPDAAWIARRQPQGGGVKNHAAASIAITPDQQKPAKWASRTKNRPNKETTHESVEPETPA
jgi:excisionase family DNA binding protein